MGLQTTTTAPPGVTGRRRSPARELVEVAVAYALIEGALWSAGAVQAGWALAGLAWIVAATVMSHRPAQSLGITWRGLRQSAWVIAAAIMVSGLLFLTAWLQGTLHPLAGAHKSLWHAWLYAVWALVQEFILQSFLYVRLEAVLSKGWALPATALLFAVAHIPNPILIPASLVLALILTSLFARYRNVYTLAAAHAILGLALSVTLPQALLHNMRVGAAYWLQ